LQAVRHQKRKLLDGYGLLLWKDGIGFDESIGVKVLMPKKSLPKYDNTTLTDMFLNEAFNFNRH